MGDHSLIETFCYLINFIQKSFNYTKMGKSNGGGFTKKMKVSGDLAAIIGRNKASRAEIIKDLWAYLKKHDLQDPENKQFFTPDKKMAKVFGTESIRAFSMSKFIGTHLSEL